MATLSVGNEHKYVYKGRECLVLRWGLRIGTRKSNRAVVHSVLYLDNNENEMVKVERFAQSAVHKGCGETLRGCTCGKEVQ